MDKTRSIRPRLFGKGIVLWLAIASMLLLSGCFFLPTPNLTLGFGTIFIDSVPRDAKILLDGKDTGKVTPALLERVPAGLHELSLLLGDQPAVTRSVQVIKDENVAVHVALDNFYLTGKVTASAGGSVVAGAEVTAYLAGTSLKVEATVTDEDGVFGLYLPDGLYDVVVTKEGYAAGKVQSVSVSADSPQDILPVIRPLLSPGGTAKAPTLKVAGLEAGDRISTLTAVKVTVTESAHPIDRIEARIGHRDISTGAPPEATIKAFFTDELAFLLNPADFPDAYDSFVWVVAYDIEGNRTEVTIPFRFEPPTAAPAAVYSVKIQALTVGPDIGAFMQAREEALVSLMGGSESIADVLQGFDPAILRLADGSVVNLASLRQDITLLVKMEWLDVDDAVAYRVERAWSAAGPWQLLATVPGLTYVDTDARLEPKRPTYYRIVSVGPDGSLGPPSTPLMVTPLPRFEVALVSPADGATGVGLTPKLQWTYNDVGTTHYFEGLVMGATDDIHSWHFIVENRSEVTYNEDGWALLDLYPGKLYRWDLIVAEAYTVYSNSPVGVSSAHAFGDPPTINGAFLFTTGGVQP